MEERAEIALTPEMEPRAVLTFDLRLAMNETFISCLNPQHYCEEPQP